LVIYTIPTRGFTAAVSVFMGTPPAKPLKCKSVFIQRGALVSDRRAEPNGGKQLLSGTEFDLASGDIIETSGGNRSWLS